MRKIFKFLSYSLLYMVVSLASAYGVINISMNKASGSTDRPSVGDAETYVPAQLTAMVDNFANEDFFDVNLQTQINTDVEDIIISSEMFHLGDDNFSANSANSSEFKGKSIGPFYSKTFMVAANALTKKNYLVIGSIIGIDTLIARSLRQNAVVNSFSSPPVVFVNGSKIAEIQLNGDGQRIFIPQRLLKPGQMNEVTITTGRNLKQTAYIDYDDIEFMNLSIQSE